MVRLSMTRWKNTVSAMNLRRFWLPVGVLVVLGVVWQIVASADTSPARVVPAPSEILTAMIATRQTLLTQHIPQTMLETLVGLGIALLLGVLLAGALDF